VDYFRKVAEHADAPVCECGAKMRQLITATHIQPDIPEYTSPIDGRVIRGRRARKYDLERSNSREYEGLEAEQKEAARIRAHKEKQIEAKVDETLQRTITDLDASNRLTRTGERSDQSYTPENARTY
jgi:hypothetical protein